MRALLFAACALCACAGATNAEGDADGDIYVDADGDADDLQPYDGDPVVQQEHFDVDWECALTTGELSRPVTPARSFVTVYPGGAYTLELRGTDPATGDDISLIIDSGSDGSWFRLSSCSDPSAPGEIDGDSDGWSFFAELDGCDARVNGSAWLI